MSTKNRGNHNTATVYACQVASYSAIYSVYPLLVTEIQAKWSTTLLFACAFIGIRGVLERFTPLLIYKWLATLSPPLFLRISYIFRTAELLILIGEPFWCATTGAILLGFGTALNVPSSKAMIAADTSGVTQRAHAFAVRAQSVNVGVAIGSLSIALWDDASFKSRICIAVLAQLCVAIVAYFSFRSYRHQSETHEHASVLSSPSGVIQSGVKWHLALAAFVYALALIQLHTVLPARWASDIGVSFIGILFFINAAIVAMFQTSVADFASKHPASLNLRCGFVLLGAGLYMAGRGFSFELVIIGVVLLTVGEMVLETTIDVAALDGFAARQRMKILLAQNFATGVGIVCGATLGALSFSYSLKHNISHLYWLFLALGVTILGVVFSDYAAKQQNSPSRE